MTSDEYSKIYNEIFYKQGASLTLKERAARMSNHSLEYVINHNSMMMPKWIEACKNELAERVLLGPDDGDN